MIKPSYSTRFIYVIGAEPGPFKIGIATYLRSRLSGIQTGSHKKLTVLHHAEVAFADAGKVERLAHKLLSAYRLSGEWFNVSISDAKAAVDHAVSIARVERAEAARALELGLAAKRAKKIAAELEAARKAEAAKNFYVQGATLVRRVTIDEYLAENDRIQIERSPKRQFLERMKQGKRKKAEKLAQDMADVQAWLDANPPKIDRTG